MAQIKTWAAALSRLSYVCGGYGDEATATAEEWLRGAVAARWGKDSLYDLSRVQRQLAFQKTCGVVLALEDLGEIAFALDVRAITAAAFARYFDGVKVEGPPWRLTPYEDLPLRAEWCESANFSGAAEVSVP